MSLESNDLMGTVSATNLQTEINCGMPFLRDSADLKEGQSQVMAAVSDQMYSMGLWSAREIF